MSSSRRSGTKKGQIMRTGTINLFSLNLAVGNVRTFGPKKGEPRSGMNTVYLVEGGYVQDLGWPAGTKFKIISVPKPKIEAVIEEIGEEPISIPGSSVTKKENSMVGGVYAAVVVQTRKVAAGAGLTTTVDKSELVFAKLDPFIAVSDEVARSVVLAEAIAAGVDINDVTAPVEIKLQKLV